MFKLLYRQRRRILFSGTFLLLTLLLHSVFEPWQLTESSTFVLVLAVGITGIIVACAFAITVLLFVAILPLWRTMVEMCAFTAFISYAISNTLPIWLNIESNNLIFSVLSIGGLILFYSIFYGSLLERLGIKLTSSATRSFKSNLGAEELWDQMVPTQFEKGTHWDPKLIAITPSGQNDGRFEFKYAQVNFLVEMPNVQVLIDEPYSHFKYAFETGSHLKKNALVNGTFEISITPHPKGGHKVTLHEEYFSAPANAIVLAWFDDRLGSRVDYIKAKQRGKRDFSTEGHHNRKVLRNIT